MRILPVLLFLVGLSVGFVPQDAFAQVPAARATPSPSPSPTPTQTPGPPFGNMQWREIGPALPGGRATSVAGSQSDPNFYVLGTAGGGVWMSRDGGETWKPIFEKEKVASIGAVAIDPKDSKTLWVGTGETNPRNDVIAGGGVFKSTDGGKKWTNVGLSATRYIGKILIDPRDSNHVIVGALGDVFSDSEDRGVYATADGGKTWTKTLYVSNSSGVADMVMDSHHPNVLYAGMWHFRRQPWTFTSGGEDNGLYKSSDGGQTWSLLSGHGLPNGMTGRIGLAIAPSDSNRIYALIESAEGTLWRSDNGGNDWKLMSKDSLIVQRPFYFSHIKVDPKDPDHVFAMANAAASSHDGGKTFRPFARQVHGDFHDFWIAPNDPARMVIVGDGGFARSVDGGQNWFYGRNLPIGQVYHVGVSLHENPYLVCGGWQDNNGWCGPSNSLDPAGVLNKHWFNVTGGDGTWAVPDPIDPNWIWADSQVGSVGVYNKVTKDSIVAQPYFADGAQTFNLSTSKYRFNWASPIAFAPWDGHIGWLGGNVIFQSTDRGRHWRIISPDLTRNDKSHQQPSGGPITHDVSGAEYSDTILDIEGSALRRGEIWVGTDDGLIQLTRDGGKTWNNVTPPAAAPYGRVENVAPSTLDAGTAYANYDYHYLGNFKPYIYVTHDYGKTWKPIVNGLPGDQPVRAVRPDLHERNIVYAGTDAGIWISLDGGASWQDFKNNLPTVSVQDIRFQPEWNDLVIATHGRSLYIMDDMRPIQAIHQGAPQGDGLFAPRTAYEYSLHSDDEGNYTDYAGHNPPYGAVIYFTQKAPAKTSPLIEILDDRNRVIRTIQGTHKVGDKEVPYVTNNVGLNSYAWDFNIDGPVKWKAAAKERYQGPNEGPGVPPGTYTVRVTINAKAFTQHFTVKPDPHTIFTQRELVQGFELSRKYVRDYSQIDTMLNSLDELKKQLDAQGLDAKVQADAALRAQVAKVAQARTALFDELTANYQNDEDFVFKAGALREDVNALMFGTVPITPAAMEFAARIDARMVIAAAHYDALKSAVASLNASLQAASVKPVKM